MDLNVLLAGCENLTISVTAEDLREYSRNLIAETIDSIRKYDLQNTRRESEHELISRSEATHRLNIVAKTIIEWEKKGIIKSYRRMGRVMYRSGDIDKLTKEVQNNKNSNTWKLH